MPKKKLSDIMRAAVAMGILGYAILINDIVQVVSGTVDWNRHIPFFMPVLFAVFVAMAIWIDRQPERARATIMSEYGPDAEGEARGPFLK